MSALPSKRTAGRGGAAWPTPTLCLCHVRALVPRGVHKRASLAKSSQHAEHLRARQPMDGTWDVANERFTHPKQIKTNALEIKLAGACWQGCHRTQRSHADYTTLFQALLVPSRSDVTRQALSGFSQTTQVPEGFHLPRGQVWASTDPCPKYLGPCRHELGPVTTCQESRCTRPSVQPPARLEDKPVVAPLSTTTVAVPSAPKVVAKAADAHPITCLSSLWPRLGAHTACLQRLGRTCQGLTCLGRNQLHHVLQVDSLDNAVQGPGEP